ncbi:MULTISPECIES: COG1470 family protein [Dehalococcoides]|uniref:COG1470 family protein n=1 Tax=Dehalococcoides TaxID=61434 RepID=UPI0005B5615D|nr:MULTISPECIES: NEW3 domain-containing protein [Dehalococcoides]QYY58737.1 NEW3 domain-containing protein [Dehalococcoides mccartyi]BAQ35361.1 hypothetical protein UCH007_14030 [Dehalococcoides sp. UCH007]
MKKFITNFKIYRTLSGLVCAGLLFGSMLGGLFPSAAVTAQTEKSSLSLYLLSGYYYMDIIPGEAKKLYLELENSGTQEIFDITLSADLPANWVVEYNPASVDYLSVGQRMSLEAVVLAPLDASRGEYNLVFIAEYQQIRTFSNTILVVRDTSGLWQWVGLGLGAVMIGGFVLLYRHFNRN